MDKLTALLEEHVRSVRNGRCSCGWRHNYKLGAGEGQQFRSHIAEMLRPLLAEVWDESFREAEYESDGFTSVSGWTNRNPYNEKETN